MQTKISSILVSILYFASPSAAEPLGAYNVDPDSVSVSGISSGGAMAAQLGVAYSSIFKTGFGVFAGLPFDCARNQLYTLCMYNNNPSIALPLANMKAWSGTKIDTLDNLRDRRVYLQVGTADSTVGVRPMEQLKSQLSNFIEPSNLSYDTITGASHVFPTDFDAPGNNPCSQSSSPFISNCGYDGAGAALKWMYGTLNPRAAATLSGSVQSFDQTGPYGSRGMGGKGYLYVPRNCANGSVTCKLHVALHGCQQSHGQIQTKFVDNTGYNRWADTNNIIILYPQTVIDGTFHFTWNGWLPNPNACWDWVGWYGNDADQKGGSQMKAIISQITKITSGFAGTEE